MSRSQQAKTRRSRLSPLVLKGLLLVTTALPAFAGEGPPVCVETFQFPDTTVAPVPAGTQVTLAMFATSVGGGAFINGVSMTPLAPDTYTLSYNALLDETVVSLNPSGLVICTWELDVDLPIVEVPTLGGAAQVLLSLLVAAAALMFLRHGKFAHSPSGGGAARREP